MRQAVASDPRLHVSHDPEAAGEDARGCNWLELLIDGMTFDLTGLAPGRAVALPEISYRFDCADDFPLERHAAVSLVPGPHLAAGSGLQPVVRAHLALASALTEGLHAVAAVAWEPSQAIMGTDYFRKTVAAWLNGGPFPALGLTAFRTTLDDGVQSVGLAQFLGQELRIEPALVTDRAQAVMLGVRLVNHLIASGRIEGSERITAPDGQTLCLEPSANGRFVRIFPG